MGPSANAVKVFISHSEKDQKQLEELTTHLAQLRRQKQIEIWHRGLAVAGSDTERQIDQQLQSAEVILLFISPSYLASDSLFEKELTPAMDRHRRGQCRVIPIFVRPVDLAGQPFASLAPLPRDGRPISAWPKADEAWLEVAKGIRQVVEMLRQGIPIAQGATMASPNGPSASPPSRPALRQRIEQTLRTSSDFDAFCLDYFPQVYQRFSNGMDRLSRVNLLLTLIDAAEIENALNQYSGSR